MVRLWKPKRKISSQDFALFASSISSECLPPYSVIKLEQLMKFLKSISRKKISTTNPRGSSGCPLCEMKEIGDRSWNSEILDKRFENLLHAPLAVFHWGIHNVN